MSDGILTPAVSERDHAIGPADAPVTLVEYGDFECPHCARAHPVVERVRRVLGDRLRFVYRHFPLAEAHPHAEHAAEATEAAADIGGERAFWAMHDALFEHQDALDDEDLVAYAENMGVDPSALAREIDEGTPHARVRADFKSGVRSGVNGTPTFFVNGERWDGNWMDVAAFTAALRAGGDS